MPETVMATYRVIPAQEDAFRALLQRHVPTLRELGLAAETPVQIFRYEQDGGPVHDCVVKFCARARFAETFTGTGLTELNTARFQFEMYNGTLGVISSFDVMVNNTNVGNFVLSNPGVQTYDLTFDNLAVAGAGAGDDYTLEIVATSAIPFGAGGWNFRAQEGIATLTQVPTPGAAALLGLGGLVAGARRRR